MNQVIILEGPDGGGKTILAQSLVEKYGFKYEHEGPPEPSWSSDCLFRHYVMTLYKAQHSRQPVVLDRHYLGETIYGPVMRDRSLLTDNQVTLIERIVRAGGTRVVLCLPHWDNVLRNWLAKKGQDYVDKSERLHTIYKMYHAEAIDGHDGLLERYDYTRTKDFKVYSRPELPPWVIGSPIADILLVGERVNTRITRTDWAFFASNGSSGYLNRVIREAGLTEVRIALMNAYPPNKAEFKELEPVIRRLPLLRRVVCLGREASRACQIQGIKHTSLHHPSYIKRFNLDRADYVKQLREACQ